jgi:hypothetical protein
VFAHQIFCGGDVIVASLTLIACRNWNDQATGYCTGRYSCGERHCASAIKLFQIKGHRCLQKILNAPRRRRLLPENVTDISSEEAQDSSLQSTWILMSGARGLDAGSNDGYWKVRDGRSTQFSGG